MASSPGQLSLEFGSIDELHAAHARPLVEMLALESLDALEKPREDEPQREQLAAQQRERRDVEITSARTDRVQKILAEWLDRKKRAPNLDLWTRAGADAADAIDVLLRRPGGPYALDFCTFSLGESSLRRLRKFREAGRLTRIYAVADCLMLHGSRAAPAAAALKQIADRWTTLHIHAKAYVLTPADPAETHYTVTGSANLTTNPRVEVLQVSTERSIANFYGGEIRRLIHESTAVITRRRRDGKKG